MNGEEEQVERQGKNGGKDGALELEPTVAGQQRSQRCGDEEVPEPHNGGPEGNILQAGETAGGDGIENRIRALKEV